MKKLSGVSLFCFQLSFGSQCILCVPEYTFILFDIIEQVLWEGGVKAFVRFKVLK